MVSVLATAGIGYVIYKNLIPVPASPYDVLPYVFLGLILIGAGWYLYLLRYRPDVARRVGSIQTLSDTERERLADLGILQAIAGESAAAGRGGGPAA